MRISLNLAAKTVLALSPVSKTDASPVPFLPRAPESIHRKRIYRNRTSV